MPSFPHDRPHFFLQNHGNTENYKGKSGGPKFIPIERNRVEHATKLYAELNNALNPQHVEHIGVQGGPNEKPGYYLEFNLSSQGKEFIQSLENRTQGIELVSVRPAEGNAGIQAIVYVPFQAREYFRKRIKAYQDEDTKKTNRPKHERLITSINAIHLAEVQSLFTDDIQKFPHGDAPVWWEVWLRSGTSERFIALARDLNVTIKNNETLKFAEREIVLVNASVNTLGQLMNNTGDIAELRIASDTPALFLQFGNFDQAEWSRNLAQRVQPSNLNAPAICILDSGVTHTHLLLEHSLAAQDVHTFNPNWGTGDSAAWQGHGTAMAGVALYGDLQHTLEENGDFVLHHRLESVKMLHPEGLQHDPLLYGAVTAECIARVEIQAPLRKRVICLAVTSNETISSGRPSSWSAEIDTLSYAGGEDGRLIIISAGNLKRENIVSQNYLDITDLEQVQNPAQSWNALTVGAFTEKTVIQDALFNGWTPIAPVGDLNPTSSTSVMWQRQWPIKPDIVCEGGNWATDGEQIDSPEDLALLTTHHDPQVQQFTTIRDTSAAAARVSEIAARILAARPNLWTETVRGLLIHSARWTQAMQARINAAANMTQKTALVRRYGYGVPDYTRALLSSINDVTLIAEDSIQPFRRNENNTVVCNQMNLHLMPWPKAELEALGATEIELRVTLSYFIEPNPGERGWTRRHRYASHALRFALKRDLESVDAFRARINAAVELEEENHLPDAGPDNWLLGTARNVGSIHSDYWQGTAVDLAKCDAIAIYPVTGWWKEKPHLEKYNQLARYSLIASINATAGEIDIYTPIQIALEIPVEIN